MVGLELDGLPRSPPVHTILWFYNYSHLWARYFLSGTDCLHAFYAFDKSPQMEGETCHSLRAVSAMQQLAPL